MKRARLADCRSTAVDAANSMGGPVAAAKTAEETILAAAVDAGAGIGVAAAAVVTAVVVAVVDTGARKSLRNLSAQGHLGAESATWSAKAWRRGARHAGRGPETMQENNPVGDY